MKSTRPENGEDIAPPVGSKTDNNAKITKTKRKIDKSTVKKTNRINRSCSTCKKRKVKCNFEIPCDRCISRNQAHLCTRDPVIFDGLLINNDNEQELKFSQENEVLKMKIKELQNTISVMKDALSKKEEETSYKRNDVGVEKSFNTNTLPKERTAEPNIKQNTWNTYSITMSLLDKGLAHGLDDSTGFENEEMNFNREDWLILKHKKYTKFKAEDSRGQCWQYQLECVGKIPKSHCDLLIKQGMKYLLCFPLIDIKEFWNDYEEYWSNLTIKEKHISPVYNKTAKHYRFLSLMYALMAFGVYQCDDDAKKILKFSDDDWDTYSKGLFGCSLECLYRGRFITNPSFITIQVIGMLRSLCALLGGNMLADNLIGISFFIAFKLRIPKSSIKLWHINYWHMLTYEWFDDKDRLPLEEMEATNALTEPEKYVNGDPNYINWSNYYLLFYIQITRIRKKYYYEDTLITLDQLRKADLELRCLSAETFASIESFNSAKYPDVSKDSINYINFHMSQVLYHAMLEVNLKISSFIDHNTWLDCHYSICLDNARNIIRDYVQQDVPIYCKSYPIVCKHVVYACVFLLVDCLLDPKSWKTQKSTINLVKRTLPVFKSYKCVVKPAIRGIYVIEKLIGLLNSKKNFTQVAGNSTGTGISSTKRFGAEGQDEQTSSLVPHKDDGEVSSGEYSDSDEDNDQLLYYSTMVKQKYNDRKGAETVFVQNGPQDAQMGIQRDGHIDSHIEVLHQQVHAQAHVLHDIHQQSLLMKNFSEPVEHPDNKILPYDTGPLSIPNLLSPRAAEPNLEPNPEPDHQPEPEPYDRSFIPTFSDIVSTPVLQPQIHHTIMDILEDNGWVQFMNTIDDLDISFDVK